MSLFSDHSEIDAVIEHGGDGVGWYLYLTLPSGETRDYLQDTKEIAIQQAFDDFGIPLDSWQEAPSLNRRWIVQDLSEAQEELQSILKDIQNPTYSQGEFVVAMSHLYHHINTAWNARFESDEAHRECIQQDFDRWRKFPKDEELLLE